ncbi:MAG: hypothetical protein Q4D14_05445 [Bacteroidales bacterium]|nr:hypothetical protein [Bacteroidales bacterium]
MNISFKRVRALTHYELISEAKLITIILFVMFLVEIIMLSFFGELEFSDIKDVSKNWLGMTMFMLAICTTARYLRPAQTTAYTTLPGSSAEKFMAQVSLYLIIMAAVTLLRLGILEIVGFVTNNTFSVIDVFLDVPLDLKEFPFSEEQIATYHHICCYTHFCYFILFAMINAIIRFLSGTIRRVGYIILLPIGIISSSFGLLPMVHAYNYTNSTWFQHTPWLTIFIVLTLLSGWLYYKSFSKVQAN